MGTGQNSLCFEHAFLYLLFCKAGFLFVGSLTHPVHLKSATELNVKLQLILIKTFLD